MAADEGKKELVALIIKVLVAVLTGIASAIGVSSCMSAVGLHGLLASM